MELIRPMSPLMPQHRTTTSPERPASTRNSLLPLWERKRQSEIAFPDSGGVQQLSLYMEPFLGPFNIQLVHFSHLSHPCFTMLFASLLALPSASHPRRELQEDASDLFGSDEDVAQIMTPIRAVIRTSRLGAVLGALVGGFHPSKNADSLRTRSIL